MHRDTWVRTRSSALLVILAILPAACATGPAPTSSATIAPTADGATAAASHLEVTEAEDGRSVAVPVGSEVVLVLGSTYWQLAGSSDPAVLALVSGPAASTAPMGACVPGAGCGTVTAVFRAIAPGWTKIVASRSSCGEALRCTGTSGAYEVTIIVGG